MNRGHSPALPNCIYDTVAGSSHFAPLLVGPFKCGKRGTVREAPFDPKKKRCYSDEAYTVDKKN